MFQYLFSGLQTMVWYRHYRGLIKINDMHNVLSARRMPQKLIMCGEQRVTVCRCRCRHQITYPCTYEHICVFMYVRECMQTAICIYKYLCT